jgi:hypothetical protein
LRAHQAFKLYKYGVPIQGKAANDLRLLEGAIWVVLGKDQKGNIIKTGTAFSLQGIGVVSCGHVFRDPKDTGLSIHKWEILSAYNPHDLFPLIEFTNHPHIDLAILHFNAPLPTSLQRSKCKIKTRDPVTVIGFPEWNTIGDKIFQDPGRVSQTKTISGVDHILTNRNIGEGNSGGPLLDNEGLVIGVVVYGSKSPGLPNSGIEIKHIDQVKSEPKKAL